MHPNNRQERKHAAHLKAIRRAARWPEWKAGEVLWKIWFNDRQCGCSCGLCKRDKRKFVGNSLVGMTIQEKRERAR